MSDAPVRPRSLPHHISTILDGRVQAHTPEYGGYVMRSQLEADFARHLDAMGERWVYEPRPFTDKDGRGYLPDFLVGERMFIEVKPTLAEVREAARRMESIWLETPDALLVVACAEHCRFFYATKGHPWSSFVDRWRH